MSDNAPKTIAYRRVVDLSHPIHSGIPRWPGDPAVGFATAASIKDDGYLLRRFTMGEHSGTHLSSPAAFYPDAAGPADLPADALVVPAVVIDISAAAAGNPDYALSVDDIADWERRYGAIPAASLVLLCAGWHWRWSEPERFINADTAGMMHTPGFTAEAARGLLGSRGVSGLGTDTPGIDAGTDTGLSVSRLALAQPRVVLECLNNLDQLPPTGATVIIGRLPLMGGSGAPAGVLALTP